MKVKTLKMKIGAKSAWRHHGISRKWRTGWRGVIISQMLAWLAWA
jgi:hypothetical protein